jgi:GMP synthase-like glutamine amidotransferase
MKTSIIVALLVLFAIPVEALTYKWVDKEGTHYTDDLGNIPQKYRKKAIIVGSEEDVTAPDEESNHATKPAAKTKGSEQPQELTVGGKQAQKKTYGGKAAATWKRDFAQINADIKDTEDQLSELRDRIKDTSKMSRAEYVSIQMNINSDEFRLQKLKEKLDALTDEANKADLPADLRE